MNMGKPLYLLLAAALMMAMATPAAARPVSSTSAAASQGPAQPPSEQQILPLPRLELDKAEVEYLSPEPQIDSNDPTTTQQAVPATGPFDRRGGQQPLDVASTGVSPASISATQDGGEVTTHLLTTSNGGPGVLSFKLAEIPGKSPGVGTTGETIDSSSGDPVPKSSGRASDSPGAPPTVRVEGPFSVDLQVAAQLEAATTADFFIWLRERADLSRASSIVDKNQRREFVYKTLSETADRSQAEIRRYLDGRGLGYEVFWINNSILVYGGDQAVVEAMRARDDVLRIRGVYRQMRIPDPQQLAIVTEAAGMPAGFSADAGTNADTLWNISIVKAPQVWSELGITGEGVVVANIDTGVRYTHEALNPSYRGNLGGGNYEHNHNWYPPTEEARNACSGAAEAPCDWNGHGSHTMGTMIGGDGDGPFDHDIGMAPDAQWMACMGCDDPPYYCSDAALTSCAQWIMAPTDLNGANPDPCLAPDVVNNSWGDPGEDAWYYSYVAAWNAANIIPVFSAGNAGPGCSTLGSPGSYDAVLGVGGTDSQDRNYTSTSRGPGSSSGGFAVQKPDISAPGEGVSSSTAGSNSSYAAYSGTSMAAPHVSGLVALMRQAKDTIGREEIWEILTNTAVTGLTIKNGTWCGAGPDFPNYVFGYGRIDALAAVEETLQQARPPELWLTKAASPTPAKAGSLLTYTLTVHNSGGHASSLTVSDTLPANTLFAWAEGHGWQAGNQVRWSDLDLPGGSELALSFGVTVTCVPSGTEIVNTDYQARAKGMAAPVAGPPLAIVALQPDVVAGFTFPQPTVRHYPLTFTNTSQNASAYLWDLGDGTKSTGKNPTHVYDRLGAHTVVLTATSPCQTDTLSQEMVVHDYALALGPAVATGSAIPGRTVTYTLHLTNTGTLADSFSVALGGHLWPSTVAASSLGPLDTGASAALEVYVTVPAGAMLGEDDSVTLFATSMGDPRTPQAQAASSLTTAAEAVYRLELLPPAVEATAFPGRVLTYTLHLVNAGNTPDEFDLVWAGNVWDVQMPTTLATLDAGDRAELAVRVTVPPDAAEGDQDMVVVTAISRGDSATQGSSTLTAVVPHIHRCYLPLILHPKRMY